MQRKNTFCWEMDLEKKVLSKFLLFNPLNSPLRSKKRSKKKAKTKKMHLLENEVNKF